MKSSLNEKGIEFIEARTYITKEWFNGQKKYRKVFAIDEIELIYLEIKLFNLLYGKEDQEFEVEIIYKEQDEDQEYENIVDTLKFMAKASKSEKYKYIYNEISEIVDMELINTRIPEKKFEIFINGELAGLVNFYINNIDHSELTNVLNPYFDILEVRVFHGNDIDNISKVKPLSIVKRDTIEYLYVDLVVKNKVTFTCYVELLFRYMDIHGYIKGEASIVEKLSTNDGEIVHFFTGWGKNEPSVDTYPQDKYYIDILFMSQIIARVEALIGDEEMEGNSRYWIGNPFTTFTSSIQGTVGSKDMACNSSVDVVLAKLNTLVGLEELKKQIHELLSFLKYVEVRKKKGIYENERLNLHTVLMGNAGVGKTTIARLFGELFASMGILSKGHVIEVTRTDLIAEYVGQTGPKVKGVIDKASGGILFIDEAHALYKRESSSDYGVEAIEVLIKEMMEGSNNLVVIMGGYPNEMKEFLSYHPALKSCFGYFFTIPDYTPEQLMQILLNKAKEVNLSITSEAKEEFEKIIINKYRDRDKTFGNARLAINLLNDAKMNMAKRLMNLTNPDELEIEKLSLIEKEDVIEIVRKSEVEKKLSLKIDEPLLEMALVELNNLIGLKSVKKEINELVKLTRYYNEIGKSFHKALSLHYVFAGNPGTGKTTVARLLGDIFRALGVLEKGHVVEVDRSELVAGYVGQTAIKTEKVIHSAINGILFIDEAYSLNPTSDEDFGKEAIEVLVKEMEDHRNELSVIVAGYTDLMREFINSNPGLKSRFTKILYFEDYSDEELVDIAKVMLKEEELMLVDEAERKLLELIKIFPRDKNFGNARTVRKIVDLIIKKHNLHVAEIPMTERTDYDIHFVKEAHIPQMVDVTDL